MAKKSEKKQSVGLIIFTDVPDVGIVAVLRERGFFDFEKMQLESWPGSYQPTVHGGLEKGENSLEALAREITEEIGTNFANHFSEAIRNKTLEEIYTLDKDDRTVTTYAAKIEFTLLKKLKLSPDSGTIRFVTKGEVDKIVDTHSFSKKTGVPDRTVVAMFPDDKDALVEGFKHFSEKL